MFFLKEGHGIRVRIEEGRITIDTLKPSAKWTRWDSQKEPRSYSIHVIPSWRTPAVTKGPFTTILKVLDRRCSVHEPPVLQVPNSKESKSIRGVPKNSEMEKKHIRMLMERRA
ncbi:unnamed protein product [Caenorhabditis nigoni]